MARQSDARERLIDAAIELLWQRSYGTLTVDAVCDKAGVLKGSLYHYFRSKDDLVLAALETQWRERRRPHLDGLFSPVDPPRLRLWRYFEWVRDRQLQLRRDHGRILGCFFAGIGNDCGDPEGPVKHRVQEILSNYGRYYESTLRDAQAEGDLPPGDDVRTKAKALFAFMEGFLGQARIQDDPELLRMLPQSAFQFLGMTPLDRLVK